MTVHKFTSFAGLFETGCQSITSVPVLAKVRNESTRKPKTKYTRNVTSSPDASEWKEHETHAFNRASFKAIAKRMSYANDHTVRVNGELMFMKG